MSYTTFNQEQFDGLQEPMFFGRNVNVSRYDVQKFPVFESLIEKQLSFFWRPEEVDLSTDRREFADLPPHEKHIFISNLKYQILLDSVQGRSPNVALLPIVSQAPLETWIATWSFSETIHSRSYTHIIRNIMTDPAVVFDEIVGNQEIIARASSITRHYDDLIESVSAYNTQNSSHFALSDNEIPITLRSLKEKLYLTLMAVNVLEAIRFYVSFACSFAFAERSLMEGNAKIIKLIARDEALHLSGTQQMINLMADGKDDPEMVDIAKELKDQSRQIFIDAAEQEKAWADYLFKEGSMIGLNREILGQYVEYITNKRMKAVNLEPAFEERQNPLPWMDGWLNSDNVQVAPQEVEVSSYLVGQINSDIDKEDFEDFDL